MDSLNAAQLSDVIQQDIMGQDAAISLITSRLQQAELRLIPQKKLLCSFIWVGPSDTGKTLLAENLSNYLFGHSNALLSVKVDTHVTSIANIEVNFATHPFSSTLLQAVQQYPEAIILVDDVQLQDTLVLDLFKSIFRHGFVIHQGEKYDFSQTLWIFTTQIGSEPLHRFMADEQTKEEHPTIDLLQLVLNETVLDTTPLSEPKDINLLSEEITLLLDKQFPKILLDESHVIPFMPLDFLALEKIMRAKIKALSKQLMTRFKIELHYAPEIIKFLARAAFWRKPTLGLEKLLEQYLYSGVSQEIILHANQSIRSKRLSLQLNETGQQLKYVWATETEFHPA